MQQSQNFTSGRIFAPLVRFALPVLAALFLQTMYGAVDLLVVGQFGSAADVSAVSTGSQIMQTITMVITGIAMGLTVYVAREIGAGARDRAGEIIGSGIVLFGGIALAVTAAAMLLASPMARLMQAPAEAFEQTVSYITICSAGALFIIAYNLVGSIFRGIGDSNMPLITVAIACALNIAGDLVFVAVFGLGTAGAAIATVLAQAVSVLLSLAIMRRRALPFTFSARCIRPYGAHIREILRLGIPIALQDLLTSISFLAILAIMNSLGLTVSAGVGVAEKLCGFLMLVPSAFMQAMSAFTAQNIGARRPGRARAALRCGVLSALAVGVCMWYFTFFHGELLAGLFARDAEIILAAAEYLKAYAIDCVLTSFLFCFMGYFNGCGSTTFVMAQGIIGAVGIRLPVSWLMSRHTPVSLFRIGLAVPLSTVVQIVLCGVYYRALRRKQAEELAEQPPA